MLDYCTEKGIKLECYGPLTPIIRASGGPLDPVVEKIAKDIGGGATPGQVLLKWAQQVCKGVIVTLVFREGLPSHRTARQLTLPRCSTSSKPERLTEQLEAFTKLPDLSDAQINEITEKGKTKHFRHFVRADERPAG